MAVYDLFNFLFPLSCHSCRISLYKAPLPICYSCLQDFEPADLVDLKDRVAEFQIDWTWIFSLWNYHTMSAAELHRNLKYQGQMVYGKSLGRLMGREILNQLDSSGMHFDLVVPMPLSKARFLERGYNQAEELAKGVADCLGSSVDTDLLRKKRETKKQTGLDVNQRTMNTDGAFLVSSEYLCADPSILLIDDVITTGATMASASRSLIDAGYDKISLASLCFADEW